MKPAPFDYVAAHSLDEAVAALAQGGADAKVLAGGQSLIPLLNFRLARPSLLVDLNRVAELQTPGRVLHPSAAGIECPGNRARCRGNGLRVGSGRKAGEMTRVLGMSGPRQALLLALAALVLLPATAHAASLGFAPPVYVDKTLAGGEPAVAYAPKSGRLVYTSHEGTTHIFSSNVPGAPAESG